MDTRRLVATLLIALPIYGAGVGLLVRDFLPAADRVVYDCRTMVCGNQDKLDELAAAGGHELGTLKHLVRSYLRGEPMPQYEVNFNPLPVLALSAVSRLAAPVVTYNLVLVGAWIAAGLAMCGAVVVLARSPGAGLVAGWLYLLAPMTVQIQHCRSLDYGLLFLLPLWLLSLVRAGSRWLSAAGLAVCLVCLWATNQYYAAAATALAAGWALLALSSPVGGDDRGQRGMAALRVAVAVASAMLVVGPWLMVEATALAARHGDDLALGIGEEMGSRASSQLAVWFHPLRPWTLPVLGLALAGLLLSPLRSRAAARGLGLAGLVGGITCGALLLFDQALVDAMRSSDVAWRMREIHMLTVVPATAICMLAGLGWAAVASRARGGAAVAALLVATLALGGSLPLDGRSWWQQRRATGSSLEVPPSVVAAVAGLTPAPLLLVVDAADPDLGASLQVVVALQTPVERPSQALDRQLKDLLTGRAADPKAVAASASAEIEPRCVAALLRGDLAGNGATEQSRALLVELGIGIPLHRDGDWILLHNDRCSDMGDPGQPIGPAAAP
jgi:hypothetical protein